MADQCSTSQLFSAEAAGAGEDPLLRAGAADEWLTPGRFALLLALLTVAAFPGVLLGGTAFIIRDFGMFSYPVAHFHRQCFWRGELPLWNPFNNCGLPFLAQWNTLTLYPLSLIYLLLPLTWSLSFFCLAHLFWGGLGMYFLAHRWTHHRLAAGLAVEREQMFQRFANRRQHARGGSGFIQGQRSRQQGRHEASEA